MCNRKISTIYFKSTIKKINNILLGQIKKMQTLIKYLLINAQNSVSMNFRPEK